MSINKVTLTVEPGIYTHTHTHTHIPAKSKSFLSLGSPEFLKCLLSKYMLANKHEEGAGRKMGFNINIHSFKSPLQDLLAL